MEIQPGQLWELTYQKEIFKRNWADVVRITCLHRSNLGEVIGWEYVRLGRPMSLVTWDSFDTFTRMTFLGTGKSSRFQRILLTIKEKNNALVR